MVSYTPDGTPSTATPDELAEQLATQLAQNNQLSSAITERVRVSETPLSEPIGFSFGNDGSLGSLVRYIILYEIENLDEIVQVSRSKGADELQMSIITHPSTLDKSNRLLHPPSLAKAYQYGYWPEYWAVVQGGPAKDWVESEVDVSWEFRKMDVVWKDEYYQENYESSDHWFTDSKAVTKFGNRVTDDTVSWKQYIPWYRTTAVSHYRLQQVAQTTDWSQFPDRPDVRPRVKNRFDTSTNPRVGDFIRMAILRALEQRLSSITNLSTGPDPWSTERVSIVMKPASDDPEQNTAELCPYVALKKLADYGYRPIDGWYDTPAVGYESDDPVAPRRLEFARGQALRSWWERTRTQSPLFQDAATIRENTFLSGVDWEFLLPCVRSQIITNRQLHDLAHKQNSPF